MQVPAEWAGFAYVYEGVGSISGTPAKPEHALVLGEGNHVTAAADAGN